MLSAGYDITSAQMNLQQQLLPTEDLLYKIKQSKIASMECEKTPEDLLLAEGLL